MTAFDDRLWCFGLGFINAVVWTHTAVKLLEAML